MTQGIDPANKRKHPGLSARPMSCVSRDRPRDTPKISREHSRNTICMRPASSLRVPDFFWPFVPEQTVYLLMRTRLCGSLGVGCRSLACYEALNDLLFEQRSNVDACA